MTFISLKTSLPLLLAENVTVKSLTESFRNANLKPHEIQELVEVLLGKQGNSAQLKKVSFALTSHFSMS